MLTESENVILQNVNTTNTKTLAGRISHREHREAQIFTEKSFLKTLAGGHPIGPRYARAWIHAKALGRKEYNIRGGAAFIAVKTTT